MPTGKVSPAEVEKFLKGVDYPAKKDDLVKYVKQETQQVCDILQKLPPETFNKPTDVAKAIGEITGR
ncbi:MAG TPA: DUF2795 domain-containing protein [Ktedonobacteraceae bacterium]|jgi:hypothetical protein|nr:DUF2795 domain-containing protein [Ktedonobacteraceae bacterium]